MQLLITGVPQDSILGPILFLFCVTDNVMYSNALHIYCKYQTKIKLATLV